MGTIKVDLNKKIIYVTPDVKDSTILNMMIRDGLDLEKFEIVEKELPVKKQFKKGYKLL